MTSRRSEDKFMSFMIFALTSLLCAAVAYAFIEFAGLTSALFQTFLGG